MAILIALLMVFISVALIAMIFIQYIRESDELLSVRNFFLAGFIVFQLTSAVVMLRTTNYGPMSLHNLETTATIYAFMILAFLALFFLAYRRGWGAKSLARWVPVGEAAPGVTSMLTLSFVIVAIGMFFKFVLSYVPIIGPMAEMMSTGILSLAAGLAAWAYAPRLWNPVVGGIAMVVVLLAMATVMHQAFGRRAILSILTCVMWAAYHGYWKHLPPARSLARMSVLTIGAVLVLAAFTAIRSGAERERSAIQQVQQMQQNVGQVRSGVVDVFAGQDTARNSMWILENYPERFEYMPLHSVYHFVTMPIPRMFWANKPDALGRIAVRQSGAGRQKQDNYSIGPGLVGHMAADNPWLSLVLYAIGLGLLLRFFDEIVRLHPVNPFMVLPMGTTLGHIIGMPRGELSLFTFNAIWGTIAAYILMIVVARTMATLGWRMQYAEDEFDDDAEGVYDDSGLPDGGIDDPVEFNSPASPGPNPYAQPSGAR